MKKKIAIEKYTRIYDININILFVTGINHDNDSYVNNVNNFKISKHTYKRNIAIIPRPWIWKQRGRERKLRQRTARRRVSRHRSSGPTARRLFSYRLTYLYVRTMFHFYRPMRTASNRASHRVGTRYIA